MRRIAAVLLISVLVCLGLYAMMYLKDSPHIKTVVSAYEKNPVAAGIEVIYPRDSTLFPPEIAPPTFSWKDNSGKANRWLLSIAFPDPAAAHMDFIACSTSWTPAPEAWESIKKQSVNGAAVVRIAGVKRFRAGKILSGARTTIQTSADSVSAPIFYREVNLPFIDAVKDPTRIQWRFGSVASAEKPPVVLKNLPVCGNCHSFSADGKILAMDVDYANDKGSYAIVPVSDEILLDKRRIITWSDFKREDKVPTYGLLSQISPDGKYVVSTVKDRSVFVARPGIDFSQLFFPVKGILAVYDTEKRTYTQLKGADDNKYVNSNPAWSPDGKLIAFTRSPAYTIKAKSSAVLLSQEECSEFLNNERLFLFDIYTVPFNNKNGGAAVPLKGASQNGMSNFFPRYSPDGRWMVFCQAKSFSLLQPDSKLWIVPSNGGTARLMRCNTSRMNSWHSFSPNGKWLVFSSKAYTPYTQLFLTHIDENGSDTPPVLLSQFTSTDRAANIPEFVNARADAIKKINEQFVDDVSMVRAGNELLKARSDSGAAAKFEEALKLNPKNAAAHNGLGAILAARGKTVEAVQHYREAIALMPGSVPFLYNLACALFEQKKAAEAMELFKEVIRLDPDHAKARYNYAVLLTRSGNSAEAVNQYTEVLKRTPDDVSALNNLATIYSNTGKTDKAVALYEKAIANDPKDTMARHNLALLLLKQGKDGAVEKQYEEILKINPVDAEACQNLGVLKARLGKIDEAIVYFEKAVQIRPDFTKARMNLNKALQQKKRLSGKR